MTFSEQLTEYINKLECTVKDLAKASNLTQATVSRYKTGERTPPIESDSITKLTKGILFLSKKKDLSLNKKEVFNSLMNCLYETTYNYETFSDKFDSISNALSINIAKLAEYMNFDKSYLYRVRRNMRRPHDLNAFNKSLCDYISLYHNSTKENDIINNILSNFNYNIDDNTSTYDALLNWLNNEQHPQQGARLSSLLDKIDSFNLNEYLKITQLDEINIPRIPNYFPSSKQYYGMEQVYKGELDFFKATILSKSKEPIFIYTDMPFYDRTKRNDFNKKMMLAISTCLRQGLTVNIIHYLDRSLEELGLIFEEWLPIYMTGRVNSYYLLNESVNNFHHLVFVSGSVALSGSSIRRNPSKVKYSLTTNKREVQFHKDLANELLKETTPLVEIYPEEKKELFESLYSEKCKNAEENLNIKSIFNNMDIRFYQDETVIIFKETPPKLRFVITHPIVINALSNFKPMLK